MADDKDKDELSRMKAELARYKKKFGAVDDDEKDENDRDEDKDENRRGARRARRGAGVAGKSLLVDDAETPAQASRLARLMGEFARLDSENDDTDGGVETGVRGGDPSIHARLDALEAALVDERATAAMLRLERDGYVTKGNREAVAAQFARVEKLADVADVDTMVRALTTPVPQSAGRLSAGSHDFARDSAHKDPEAEQARVARAVRDAKGDPEKFRRIIEGKD